MQLDGCRWNQEGKPSAVCLRLVTVKGPKTLRPSPPECMWTDVCPRFLRYIATWTWLFANGKKIGFSLSFFFFEFVFLINTPSPAACTKCQHLLEELPGIFHQSLCDLLNSGYVLWYRHEPSVCVCVKKLFVNYCSCLVQSRTQDSGIRERVDAAVKTW